MGKKQRVNVKNSTGKRRVGIWDHDSDTIKIAGKKRKPRSAYKKRGVIHLFETWFGK